MGYIVKNIADYTEPAPLSIVACPNFFMLQGFKTQEPVRYMRTVRFKQSGFTNQTAAATVVVFLPDGTNYALRPTKVVADIGGTTFYVDDDPARTAENLKSALLSIGYIANNFDINLYSVNTIPYTGMQAIIRIESKGEGAPYYIQWKDLSGNVDPSIYWEFTGGAQSYNYDMLTNENETAVISVDVYTGTSVLLGLNDFPDSVAKIGTLATTLKKTYLANTPLWFDMNALFSKSTHFNYQKEGFYFDPGTLIKYRFDAKLTDDKGTYTIFRSNVVSALNGFAELSASASGMYAKHVYDGSAVVDLLTNQPRVTYVPGQPVFLNFLIGEANRKNPAFDSAIGARLQFYKPDGSYLGYIITEDFINLLDLADINTFRLYLDQYILEVQDDTGYEVGIVKACVCKDQIPITNYIEFEIRPADEDVTYSPLHDNNSFVFLNALGGWDAFNFDATDKDEISPDTETYNKTTTPQLLNNGMPVSAETVYINDAELIITVEGAPVNKVVGEWLREMVKSKVIYHKDKYVLVQEFNLTDNPDSASMVNPSIKFKYSDKWQL